MDRRTGRVLSSLVRIRVKLRSRSNPHRSTRTDCMDKKAKKRIEVINKKLQSLRPRLAGSKEQADDADELKELADEIDALEAEAKKLRET